MRLQANACGRAFFYACMLVVYARMGMKVRRADSAFFFAGALWGIGCGYSVGARDYSFVWLGQCLYDGKASTVLLAWCGEGEGLVLAPFPTLARDLHCTPLEGV